MTDAASTSPARNQLRTFQALWAILRPQVGADRNLGPRIQQLVTSEKRFGSRDRKIYRELLYTAVRFLPWYEELAAHGDDLAAEAVAWLASPLPALAPLKAAAENRWGIRPEKIVEQAAILQTHRPLFLSWVDTQCPAVTHSPNLEAIHRRAPLWIRLQTNQPDSVRAEFAEKNWRAETSEILPQAIRVGGDVDLSQSRSYLEGKIEIQDLGSQLILESVGVEPATHWLDACAGAGGKTLQLARLVGPAGKVSAYDIRAAALAELEARAARAGLDNIAVQSSTTELYDGVLIDAPCSGSGTWRRSPHLKWSTTQDDLRAAARVQLELLRRYAQQVRSGGRLVYATCSIAREENSEVIKKFLEDHTGFALAEPAQSFAAERNENGLTFWPASHDSDGFFVASLRRD